MRHFRQGVGLVHELGELRRAEKFLQYRRDRFRVDQIMGHERGHFLQAHALLDGPLHAHQTDAVLVFHQFAHRAHPPVAQMIDIIGRTMGILELYQLLDGPEDIVVG